jgi:hypothetical protein
VEALAVAGSRDPQVAELLRRLDALGDDEEVELRANRSIAAISAAPRGSSGTPADLASTLTCSPASARRAAALTCGSPA